MQSSILHLEDNTRLNVVKWHNPTAIADIFLLHGYLEHSGRFGPEAKFFKDLNLEVHAYDLRGHGLSDGRRSYIKDFNLLVSDLKSVLNYTGVGINRPFFFFAHSMGGLVLLSYLLNQQKLNSNLKGIILSAPFLMPDPNLAPLLQKVAGIIGTLFPFIRTVGAKPEYISRDPNTVKKYIEDPLVDLKPSYAGSAYQILKQMKKLRPLYKNLNLPFLLMHGSNDKLSAIEGSEALFKLSTSTDKSFQKLDKFRHEITRELDKEIVFELMKKWLTDHL